MVDRYLFIKYKLQVRCLNIAKAARPLSCFRKRIYRTDEKIMCPSKTGDFEFIMYDLDGTQPYGRKLFLDPDVTMMNIDLMKSAHGKPANMDKFFKNGGRIALGVIVGAVLLWAAFGTVAAMI